MQSQKSVESFGWQWSEQVVVDTTRTFYRRLFSDMKIWSDYLDGKVIADVGSGNGRHVWALSRLTKAKEIISVELADDAIAVQRRTLGKDPRVRIIHSDAEKAVFKADFIYMVGFIQHTERPLAVLQRQIENLNEGGELVVSFYMKTVTTMALEPIRMLTRLLPKRVLWAISPLLILPFVVRKAGRENGWRNARHTAYDWFGSHSYQKYFTESEIADLFRQVGIQAENVLHLSKGLYRVRKGALSVVLDDVIHSFGKTRGEVVEDQA